MTHYDAPRSFPETWARQFAHQNNLLKKSGEEPLEPSEFLECRSNDFDVLAWNVQTYTDEAIALILAGDFTGARLRLEALRERVKL